MLTSNVEEPSSQQIEELTNLFREGIKNAEEEQKILNEEPNDVIKNVGILQALRMASESEPPRNAPPKNPRNPKRQKLDTDGTVDSPGLSPSASTMKVKGSSSVRSGSIPASREAKEPSVKIEEGSEGLKGPAGERAGKFFVGAEVAYKQAKVKEDGSQWIQCNIKSISDIGNKKRSAQCSRYLPRRHMTDSDCPGTRFRILSLTKTVPLAKSIRPPPILL